MAYTGSGDPALADYYPAWLDNLADDVTLEGSAMDGFAQGAEAVRTVLVAIRSLYEYQEFHFAGPCGDSGWLEDYTAGTLVIPGCGHHPAEETPEETLTALAAFLAPYRDGQAAAHHSGPQAAQA